MVLGNLIQINAQGNEERLLYGNPQTTYFKDVYKRCTNFAINYSKVPFTSAAEGDFFGKKIHITIPKRGDLLAGLYLNLSFEEIKRDVSYVIQHDKTVKSSTFDPQFTSYVNGIGYNCIEYINFYINRSLVQTLNGELIYTLNEIHNNHSKKQAFYKMTGYHEHGFEIGDTNTKQMDTVLSIPLFFSENPSKYLPLCALTHSEIHLEIQFKEKEKCIIQAYNINSNVGVNGMNINTRNQTITPLPNSVLPNYEKYDENIHCGIINASISMQSIYLDTIEKQLFLHKSLSYLLDIYHIGTPQLLENISTDGTVERKVDILGKHATKYIIWFLQRDDVYNSNYYNNYSYNFPIKYKGVKKYHDILRQHILNSVTINVNNEDITNSMNAVSISELQLYDKFKRSSDGIIYMFSFSLYPCDSSPSGTINLSKLSTNARLNLNMKINNTKSNYSQDSIPTIRFTYYTCYYNVLVIQDGLAGLLYE